MNIPLTFHWKKPLILVLIVCITIMSLPIQIPRDVFHNLLNVASRIKSNKSSYTFKVVTRLKSSNMFKKYFI